MKSAKLRARRLVMLLVPLAIACATGAPTPVGAERLEGPATTQREGGSIIIDIPGDRPLPFELRLSRENRPISLLEAAEMIRDALPEQHLRRIAAYVGYGDVELYDRQYEARIDFARDLYWREILHEAWRQWGYLDDGSDPFDAAIRCAGHAQFQQSMLWLVAFAFIDDEHREDDLVRWPQLNGYQAARAASRRLIEVCERLDGGLQ